MIFEVGDKIVYPMYGAGVIEKIEEREILGNLRKYYIMKISTGTMDVMVPVDNSDEIGIRRASDTKAVEEALNSLDEAQIEDTLSWNRRYRENLQKLKSGDIREVACVVKHLTALEKRKGLSTGERKMLVSAKNILLSEIIISCDCMKEDAEKKLDCVL